MEWLRIVIGILGLILLLQLIQFFRFRKELKKELTKGRSLSPNFAGKWEKSLSRTMIIIALTTILSIIYILLR